MIRYSSTAVLLAAIFACFPLAFQEQQKNSESNSDDKIVVPSDGPEAIARRDFMRTKLMYSQNIFEGMTTGDFDLIKAGIKEVQTITNGEQWVQIDNDHYRKLTEDFKTTIKRLTEAAESGNIDATALRYYQMSTSCIDCHKHIRIAKYEF